MVRTRFGTFLGLGAGAIVLGFALLASSPRRLAPSVTFAGSEAGLPYRAAAFYLTNSGPGSMVLCTVQVQAFESGRWRTISDRPLEVEPVVEGGKLYNSWPSLLPSGGHRKIVVEWPTQHPWRVSILYGPETIGLEGMTEKAKLAWRNRNFAELRGRVWVGSKTLLSRTVSQ